MATNVMRMTAAMAKQQNQARAQIFHSLFTPSHQVIGGSEKVKGQEYPDFCHPGTFDTFPYYPVTSSGTSGNCPDGPEKSISQHKELIVKGMSKNLWHWQLNDSELNQSISQHLQYISLHQICLESIT